ncbi:MAG TPA: ATP-binding cassette domain-containing protein, partial [Bdellovibrio sp.]|nr:ATP-binding cassette domain-containing protein [Bdellovibrio sp.]
AELAELMVGRRIQTPRERSTTIDSSKTVLSISNLNARLGDHQIQDISLNVFAKEIVGIAGVEGNGQDILIRALLDAKALRKTLTGEISLRGRVGSFPEDRLRFGVLSSRPVWENFLLGQQKLKKFARGIFIYRKNILQATRDAMEMYDVRPRNEFLPFEKLSGGNQQKLVVARALLQKPDVVIAAQPTRGVDIGAIEFIHNELRRSRDEGAGLLLISSELDELMALSDRILVLYKGKIVAEFAREHFDEIAIGSAMGGAQ